MSLIVNYEVRESVLTVITAEAAAARTFADGVTTNGSPIITSAALSAFTQNDVGRAVSGAGIPAGAKIDSVQDALTATMDQEATATATGVSITLAAISQGPFAASALTFRLYISALSPGDRITRADVLAAEATFSGYAAQTITSWGEIYRDGSDNVFRDGQLLQYTCHGTVSPPQTVYGVAWDDGVNVSIDPLATPVSIAVDDDVVRYLPTIAYGG